MFCEHYYQYIILQRGRTICFNRWSGFMSGLSRHAEFRPLSGIGAIIACVVLLVSLVVVVERGVQWQSTNLR